MTTRTMRLLSLGAVFSTVCLLTLPQFFDAYRISVFQTMPRDDYAPFLLRLISGTGEWPISPYGYRVLSIVPALPLYWLLPVYKFSQLGHVEYSYLRATEALTFLSYLATAGSAALAYDIVRSKTRGSRVQAALA